MLRLYTHLILVLHGSSTGNTGLSWLLTDHLGSSMLTSEGSNGTRLTEFRYKGWGRRATRAGLSPRMNYEQEMVLIQAEGENISLAKYAGLLDQRK